MIELFPYFHAVIVGVIVTLLFFLTWVGNHKEKKHKLINEKFDALIAEEPQKVNFYNIQRETELKNHEKAKKHLHSYISQQITDFIINRGKG